MNGTTTPAVAPLSAEMDLDKLEARTKEEKGEGYALMALKHNVVLALIAQARAAQQAPQAVVGAQTIFEDWVKTVDFVATLPSGGPQFYTEDQIKFWACWQAAIAADRAQQASQGAGMQVASIPTWQERQAAQRFAYPERDHMLAEIADLRAQLARTEENLHAATKEAWVRMTAQHRAEEQLARQDQGEPVAWMDPTAGCVMDAFLWQKDAANPQYSVPVYASPAQTSAAPASEKIAYDNEFNRLWQACLTCKDGEELATTNALTDYIDTRIAAASAAPGQARAAVPDEILAQWKDAYAAFVGAFDTPQMRRRMGDEYSNDARVRLRYINDAMLAASPEPATAAVPPDLTQILREALLNIRDYRADVDNNIAARSMRFYAETALEQFSAQPVEQPADDAQAKRHREIGAAVERACGDLPEGFDLHLELERGAGTVRLYFADTDATMSDFDERSDTFAGQINAAIDLAMQASKGATDNEKKGT